MDQLNWVVYELLFDQMMQERRLDAGPWRPAQPEQPKRRSSVRGAVAGALLRAGLLLDPAAGERLRGSPVPQVAPEASPRS